mmetsp:Transcript_6447/g.11183  ORF Transcript_6447/g.11183 Transcript_6447/m.11183 type:complete len:1126 (+) Transcript_6447:73-3450(+)
MNPVESPKFASMEEEVLKLWEEIDAFRTSLERNKDKPAYTFYDGPPFATGLPHYGHILAGTIKDVVTRYAHQTGHNVSRRFGWDCHGLPVEYEIDKKLGITTSAQVEEMGIAKYNAECRAIVMRYAGEWRSVVTRMGRWIDFDNDYKTMNISFMESVWWVFGELYKKGLVYRGFKVMPYSTAVHTPLSNFEAKLQYEDVEDPAVVVTFPLVDEPDVSLVAWTTTPWTLPSNLALVVHPDMIYVRAKDVETEKVYILAEALLKELWPATKKKKKTLPYEILEKFEGKTLKDKKYVPLFDYFKDMKTAFRVLVDPYVTSDAGTGVVHSAPAFGEDDYRVCLLAEVIEKGGVLPCPVDESGCFTDEVTDFKGQYVKAADDNILNMLKKQGRLVKKSKITHSYPFCYRSDTPLIYRAVPSWFIKVEDLHERLCKNNLETYWVPKTVQEKRFHNWLENARDWAVSRNRFWGTPIPIWQSEDGEETVVISSVEELSKVAGREITDLHRESIDDIEIESKQGKGKLKRVTEVFDCWFESGSMPYAQLHYPFENKEVFENGFPADFIAEGVDQTRGWFYTLLVLSTILFDKAPFKNLIVNGMVLAEDGKKMSKRLKNYPDPMDVVNQFGADALRVYLVNSPVVRAETLRFSEKGVRSVVTDVFLPWFNAYRFLAQNTTLFSERNGKAFKLIDVSKSSNVMDKWILAEANDLLKKFREEMAAYRLYTVVAPLLAFIGNLTNWYLRLNRGRLKGNNGEDEAQMSLSTLYEAILLLVRMMSPFTPFLVETMYQNLKLLQDEKDREDSVHYLDMPEPNEKLIDEDIQTAVSRMQRVIELGRQARDRRVCPLKLPLNELQVFHSDEKMLNDLRSLQTYIQEELNVSKVTFISEMTSAVDLNARAEPKKLGKRLGKKFSTVSKAIAALSNDDVSELETKGKLTVEGEEITADDVVVVREYKGEKERFEPSWSHDGFLVVLDIQVNEAQIKERLLRELVNRVQKARKQAKLSVGDHVDVFYSTKDKQLNEIVEKEHKQLEEATGCYLLKLEQRPKKALSLTVSETDVDGAQFLLEITSPQLGFKTKTDEEKLAADYFTSLDYQTTKAKLEKEGSLSIVVNDKKVTLKLKENVFVTYQESF